MLKAKILMLGPCQSGKTVLSNFLSDSTDTSLGDYQPTQGVRILEFEVSSSEINARAGMEVELWDVSGDKKFEACWPAIARDTNGVIFVFNPDQQNHDKELENWINYFTTAGVRQDQCMIFSHTKPNADKLRSRPRLYKDSVMLFKAAGLSIDESMFLLTKFKVFNFYVHSKTQHSYFVDQGGLKDTQCYVFAHSTQKNSSPRKVELPHHLRKITTVQTNLEDDTDSVRQSFNKFLSTLVTALSDKREQEELSIINQR